MMDLDTTFEELRQIMLPYAHQLACKEDKPGNLYVDTQHVMKNGKPLFFGAVQTKKNYVSYHLMPVYVNPELLQPMSDALRQRMQGKSCFNFKKVDQALFEELGQLTETGYNFYKEAGYV